MNVELSLIPLAGLAGWYAHAYRVRARPTHRRERSPGRHRLQLDHRGSFHEPRVHYDGPLHPEVEEALEVLDRHRIR